MTLYICLFSNKFDLIQAIRVSHIKAPGETHRKWVTYRIDYR